MCGVASKRGTTREPRENGKCLYIAIWTSDILGNPARGNTCKSRRVFVGWPQNLGDAAIARLSLVRELVLHSFHEGLDGEQPAKLPALFIEHLVLDVEALTDLQ